MSIYAPSKVIKAFFDLLTEESLLLPTEVLEDFYLNGGAGDYDCVCSGKRPDTVWHFSLTTGSGYLFNRDEDPDALGLPEA